MLTPAEALVEVAVDSVAAAEVATALGASRLELCQALESGGLTPSLGLIETVRAAVTVPVFVMIRPRAGDFVYSAAELEAMARDIAAAKDAGADGVVIGALDRTGAIDREATARLVERAAPLPVTFHRAFDVASRPLKALEHLIEAGVRRVLTSGGATTADQGRTAISRYVRRAGSDLTILAGGGVTGDHVVSLIEQTGVREVHLSGSYQVADSGPFGFGPTSVPNPARLLRVFEALRALRAD